MSIRRVLIAGGGIGGLTAGVRLAQAGFSVTVLEQAKRFEGFGAGIQLSPNCVRVLHEMGLADDLSRVACRPERVNVRDWRSGRVITSALLGRSIEAATGFPYYHIHRADLIEVLLAAAAREPLLSLAAAERVISVEMADADIEARVQVETTQARHSAGLLVGADGVHSVVRDHVVPNAPPAFSGNVAWRATIAADRLPQHLRVPQADLWWGPGAHVVHYPVRGGRLVNLVCVVEAPDRSIESWSEPGAPGTLAERLAGWHEDIGTLIAAIDADTCFKWGLFDRSPLPAWHRGAAVLLGDACHATLPFLAQGAAMAIEDAAVLASSLTHEQSLTRALARYQRLRLPRASRVQAASRRNGFVFHMSGPATLARNLLAGPAQRWTTRWLYHHQASV